MAWEYILSPLNNTDTFLNSEKGLSIEFSLGPSACVGDKVLLGAHVIV